MQIAFSYEKNKVIQALRLHFIKQKEIKFLVILVNIFTIFSAILFSMGKIQPQPFFIGTIVWLLVLVSIWFILPYNIYGKSQTFKDNFIAYINNKTLLLETDKGSVSWEWKMFNHYFESPNFFHLYFNTKSFFLMPKDRMKDEEIIEIKQILSSQIKM